jgi:SAM-dependent methyltransferase
MSWLLVALAIVFVLDGLRMRRRIGALAVLTPSDEPVSPDHRFLAAPGVRLDEATRRAASHHARVQGLDVLEIVPGDLPMPQIMELVGLVDPATYRADRLAFGHAARQAMLVSAGVLDRARVASDPPLHPAAYAQLADTLKQHASTTTDLALATGLRSVPEDPGDRFGVLRVQFGRPTGGVLCAFPLLGTVLIAGLLSATPAGAAAFVIFHLQPLIALAGQAAHPRDWWVVPVRLPWELWIWLRTVTGRSRVGESNLFEELRATYDALLANGLEPFFEPRQDHCPLCGAGGLVKHVEAPDLFQFKPGRFMLTRCRACGHIFQNPRLSLKGLDFYYRDFYDGLGEKDAAMLFRLGAASYRARAQIVADVAAPARWLDVGTGHGHFCCVARGLLAGTRFDGLDISDAVEQGVRRGWLDCAIRGLFPALAAEMRSAYDVVSMSHYLEHTRDPEAELAAAAEVLLPGGLLMIEVPNPDYLFGRMLGSCWLPWFQPQHQHLLSASNLERLLAKNGFSVVRRDYGAHIPIDCIGFLYMALGHITPRPGMPWNERATTATRVVHASVWGLALPLLLVAYGLDHLLAPFMATPRRANAYRVLARKAPGPPS